VREEGERRGLILVRGWGRAGWYGGREGGREGGRLIDWFGEVVGRAWAGLGG